jgi:hypothetical protein
VQRDRLPSLPDRVSSSAPLREFFLRRREEAGLNRAELTRLAAVPPDFVKVIETRAQRTVDGSYLAWVMAVLGILELPQFEESPTEPWWVPPAKSSVAVDEGMRRRWRAIRKRAGWSLTDVADRSGLGSTATVREMMAYSSRFQEWGSMLVACLATGLRIKGNSVDGGYLLRRGFKWCGPDLYAPAPPSRNID